MYIPTSPGRESIKRSSEACMGQREQVNSWCLMIYNHRVEELVFRCNLVKAAMNVHLIVKGYMPTFRSSSKDYGYIVQLYSHDKTGVCNHIVVRYSCI